MTRFQRKRAVVCFTAAALLFFAVAAANLWHESRLFSRSVSWQWTGWSWTRPRIYDPCVTPEGKPSGAMVYQLGPVMLVTMRLWRQPIGNDNLPLAENASAAELDVKEPNSSNADEALFQLLPRAF